LIKPKDKRIIEMVKSKTDAKFFYHCCGAAGDFIPDFIEIGVDILNPVQVSAVGMDTARLKKEFGNDISFWGGDCDTQHVLPYGTPDEVREEFKRRINDLVEGGGFIISPTHHVKIDTSIGNFFAFWNASEKYGKYPINI